MSDTSGVPSNQGGYTGQLGIDDGTDDYNVTCAIISQLMGELRTMIPVKVMAVAAGSGGGPGPAAAGTVDVLLLVNMIDGAGNPQKHGTVLGLPYFRLGGANGQIVSDPVVGDVGYIHCADRDISAVIGSNGQQSNPGSFRRFAIKDGVYVGGMLSPVPTQYLVFTANGLTLADKNGNSIVMAAAGITITDANGNTMTFKSGSIAVSTTLFTQTGGITAGFGGADSVTLQFHTHPSNGSPPTPGT